MPQAYELPELITDLPEFEDLAARASSDPLDLIDHCMRRSKEYDEGVRWMHWSVLITLYAAALVINQDPELIAKLLEHSCFKDSPYRRSGKHVLRLTFLAGQGIATKGKSYKRACREASLIQPLFQKKTEPVALFAMIQFSGGLKGLADMLDPSDTNEQGSFEKAGSSGGPDDGEQSGDQPSSADDSSSAGNSKAHSYKEKVEAKTAKTSKIENVAVEASVDDETVIIELEVTRKRLNRLKNAPAGSIASVAFEPTGSDEDIKRLRVTSLKIDRQS